MGARLKDLDFGPYVQGSLAGHARTVGAAEATAEGKAAIGRGVALGMGAFTAKALRKHQESREDARTARQDANIERDNARADDALQLHKDQVYAGLLHDQMASADAEIGAAQPLAGPDGASIGGDPTALAAAMEKRKEKAEALEMLMGRIAGSPTFKAQQAAQAPTQGGVEAPAQYGERHMNQDREMTTSLPSQPPAGYNGPRSPGAEAAFVRQGKEAPAQAAAPAAPVNPLDAALKEAYDATDRAGAAQAREQSLGQMVDDAQAKLRAAKNPTAYRDWTVKLRALLDAKEKAHQAFTTESFAAKTAGNNAEALHEKSIKDAEIARKHQEIVGAMKVHGLTPTGDPGVDAETLRLKQAQVAKEQEIAASKAKGEFTQANKGEDITAKDAKDLESAATRYREVFGKDPDPKLNATELRGAVSAQVIGDRTAKSKATTQAQKLVLAARKELDDATDDLNDPANKGDHKIPGDAGGLGNDRRARVKTAEKKYRDAIEGFMSAAAGDEPGWNGAEGGTAPSAPAAPASAPKTVAPDMKAKIRAALGSIDPNSPAGQEIIRKVAGGG